MASDEIGKPEGAGVKALREALREALTNERLDADWLEEKAKQHRLEHRAVLDEQKRLAREAGRARADCAEIAETLYALTGEKA